MINKRYVWILALILLASPLVHAETISYLSGSAEWAQNLRNGFSVTDISIQSIGQSFQLNGTGILELSGVKTSLKKSASESGTVVRASIHHADTTDDNTPIGAALGSVDISQSSLSTSQTTETFTFASPIELNNSQKYILVISTNATNTGGVRAFYNDGTNPYSQGQMTAFLGGETEWRPDSGFTPPDATDDLDFEITYSPPSNNITFTSNINNFTVEVDGYGNYTTTSAGVTTDINATNPTLTFTYYNASVGDRPYFNLTDTQEFNDSIRSYTATLNPYTKINATEYGTGNPILSFNVTYDSTTYESDSNGNVFLPSYNQTIDILINASGYAIENYSYNSIGDFQAVLYTKNALELYIFDEKTDTILDNTTFFLDIIGDTLTNVTNTTVSDGQYNISLLSPDTYQIDYESTVYPKRQYFVTLNSQERYNITLYSLNSSYTTFITFTLSDNDDEGIPGCFVAANRLFPSRASYKTVAMCRTDNDGQCGTYLELLQGYSYTLTCDGVSQSVDPSQLLETSKTFTFQSTSPFQQLKNFFNINYNLSYNNATQNFRLDYSVANGNSYTFCLSLYNHTFGGRDTTTPFKQTCQSSASGLITINQNIVNQTIEGRGTVNTESGEILLGSLIVGDKPKISSYLGNLALFIIAALLIVLVSFGSQLGASQAIVITLVGIGLVGFIGLLSVSVGVLSLIIFLGVIYLVGVNRS